MSQQFLAICEETTRGTKPGSPTWLYLPVLSQLQPKFVPKDEPRKEFRGNDSALGDSSVRRVESQWSYTLECAYYPCAAVALLLTHSIGKAGTRTALSAPNEEAYTGILYPVAMPYGTGYPLADKAIGISANTDEAGTTKSQYFGGGRIKSVSIVVKGVDDVRLSFEIQGAGGWVGAVDQTAITDPDFSTLPAPFVSGDALFYAGSGISRTGTAPDFTAIGAGTMNAMRSDELTIKITNGLEDKTVINGVRGPSFTTRNSQFAVEASLTIDYADPSSGFSSADEFKRIFSGVATTPLLLKLDNGEIIDATSGTAKFESWVDLPNMMLKADPPERNAEGKTPSIKMTYTSLYDTTAEYPCALFTQDDLSAY